MARGIKLGGKEAHPWEGEILGSRMGEENWLGDGHRYSVRLVQRPGAPSPKQCADSLLALVCSV